MGIAGQAGQPAPHSMAASAPAQKRPAASTGMISVMGGAGEGSCAAGAGSHMLSGPGTARSGALVLPSLEHPPSCPAATQLVRARVHGSFFVCVCMYVCVFTRVSAYASAHVCMFTCLCAPIPRAPRTACPTPHLPAHCPPPSLCSLPPSLAQSNSQAPPGSACGRAATVVLDATSSVTVVAPLPDASRPQMGRVADADGVGRTHLPSPSGQQRPVGGRAGTGRLRLLGEDALQEFGCRPRRVCRCLCGCECGCG